MNAYCPERKYLWVCCLWVSFSKKTPNKQKPKNQHNHKTNHSLCRWYRGCLERFSATDTARHGSHLFTNWNSLLFFFLCFRSSQACYESEEVCHNSTNHRRIDHCAILHQMNLLGQMNHYPVLLMGIPESKRKYCLPV